MPRQNCNSMAVFAVTVYSVFTTFVYFPSLKVYLEMFLKMYWELVRLQEAHLLE